MLQMLQLTTHFSQQPPSVKELISKAVKQLGEQEGTKDDIMEMAKALYPGLTHDNHL